MTQGLSYDQRSPADITGYVARSDLWHRHYAEVSSRINMLSDIQRQSYGDNVTQLLKTIDAAITGLLICCVAIPIIAMATLMTERRKAANQS